MKWLNSVWIGIFLFFIYGNVGNVWAYGDGSSGGTGFCQKMSFSEFNPVNTAEVAPQSAFSFFASGATYPKSIKVTIKGESVPVTVTPKKDGYEVTGRLPDAVKGVFAKINIEAKGANQCEHTGAWLVKVTE